MRTRRAQDLIGAVSLVSVVLLLLLVLRDEGTPPPPPDRRPYVIGVVGRHATVDTRAVRAAIAKHGDVNLLGGRTVEVAEVPRAEELAVGELLNRYPRLIALLGETSLLSGDVSDKRGQPVELQTCEKEENYRYLFARTLEVNVGEGDIGYELAHYLRRAHDARRLLILAGDNSIETLEQHFRSDRANVVRQATVVADDPSSLPLSRLRYLLGETRADTVFLDDDEYEENRGTVLALKRAGFRGRVITDAYAPDSCEPEPDSLPDGVYRYRMVSPGARGIRKEDCTTEMAAYCREFLDLPRRPGALQEYQAAQAVVTAVGRPTDDVNSGAEMRNWVAQEAQDVSVPGLQGNKGVGSEDPLNGLPIWIEQRSKGRWVTLGTARNAGPGA